MAIPRLIEMIPPGEYPVLHACAVVAVLLLAGGMLLGLFTWIRDAHKRRKDRR